MNNDNPLDTAVRSGQNDSSDRLLIAQDLETIFRTENGVVRAVDEVDLHLNRGEVLGLVGESGAGKSATARSIVRLIESPGEIVGGTVEFDGQDILEMSETELREFRSSRLGVIFQDPTSTLNPTKTIGNQVMEAVTQYRSDISKEAARERAVELLTQVGIPNTEARIDDYPHEFSGGQKQRIVTAIAIACEPDLLIADEPTTALDVTVQAQILDLLNDLREEFDMSILFITHDLGVVREVCDRCSVMYAGSIVESGPVESVFTDPRHPYTKGLLASIPGLETGLERDAGDEHRLDVVEGTMPDLTDDFEGCKYAPRCPGATEECLEAHPNLEHPSDAINREVACYRSAEIDDINYSSRYESVGLSWEPNVGQREMSESVLDVSGLEKEFDTRSFLGKLLGNEETIRAVDGIDLELTPGETLGLVGESGCGKSTAVRAILQLLEPTDGDVTYRGNELTQLSDRELRQFRRDIQIVYQDPKSSLNPRRTVRRIVRRPMDLHDIQSPGEREQRVTELIEAVNLDKRHLDRYPHELSGGQQQRVGIARALAVNPEVIMLDEPVSGLDVSVQAQILNLLADLQDELDLSYLLISHDLSVVEAVCDRIAVMYLGKIVEQGTVDDVFTPPFHPYTEALLSAVPGKRAAEDRIVLEGDVPDPSNIPSGCRFHPRCPHKIGDVCKAEVPAEHVTEDHAIRCHLMREEYNDEIDWDGRQVGRWQDGD